MLIDVISHIIVQHFQTSDPRYRVWYVGSTYYLIWWIQTYTTNVLLL